jgi:hypothetical protein
MCLPASKPAFTGQLLTARHVTKPSPDPFRRIQLPGMLVRPLQLRFARLTKPDFAYGFDLTPKLNGSYERLLQSIARGTTHEITGAPV